VSILVGVDAGGTSTACAIERDGELAHASGEAANVRTVGAEVASERIVSILRGSLGARVPDAVVIGAAGAGDETLARSLRERVASAFEGARVEVYDDALIALRASVPSGDGVVLIAGTGSIAYGMFGETTIRAGGYGSLLGDEGSAFAIGRAALALALRVADGRSPSDGFAESVASELGASGGPELAARVYESTDAVGAIAALAPMVLQRASDGDRSATKIVQGAAVDLVDMVKAVLRRADATQRELPLVMTGGLLANNSLLSYLIETRLTGDLPLLATQKSGLAPIFGALTLARRLANA
jgi:N-acetylglucosamine kinase-like BadF-type ATPase